MWPLTRGLIVASNKQVFAEEHIYWNYGYWRRCPLKNTSTETTATGRGVRWRTHLLKLRLLEEVSAEEHIYWNYGGVRRRTHLLKLRLLEEVSAEVHIYWNYGYWRRCPPKNTSTETTATGGGVRWRTHLLRLRYWRRCPLKFTSTETTATGGGVRWSSHLLRLRLLEEVSAEEHINRDYATGGGVRWSSYLLKLRLLEEVSAEVHIYWDYGYWRRCPLKNTSIETTATGGGVRWSSHLLRLRLLEEEVMFEAWTIHLFVPIPVAVPSSAVAPVWTLMSAALWPLWPFTTTRTHRLRLHDYRHHFLSPQVVFFSWSATSTSC